MTIRSLLNQNPRLNHQNQYLKTIDLQYLETHPTSLLFSILKTYLLKLLLKPQDQFLLLNIFKLLQAVMSKQTPIFQANPQTKYINRRTIQSKVFSFPTMAIIWHDIIPTSLENLTIGGFSISIKTIKDNFLCGCQFLVQQLKISPSISRRIFNFFNQELLILFPFQEY